MNEEIFDRQYQHGRAQFNADLGRAADSLGRTLGDTLRVLHRIEWSAPWTRSARPPHNR